MEKHEKPQLKVMNNPKVVISEKEEVNKETTFIEESLNIHNELRLLHSAPPLVINDELNQIAQKYAEKLAQSKSFQHSKSKYKNDNMGENLYMCKGFKLTGKTMTQSWYDEISMYDFNKATFTSGTGHFTQVVWTNTKEVGFGVAQSKDGAYYGVANYYPAGNYLGQFSNNVKKKK